MIETMNEVMYAPWSDEIVKKLNDYQTNGKCHPYTCGYCRDKYHTRFIIKDGKRIEEPVDFNYGNENWKNIIILDRDLVATTNGFICLTCDMVQNWYYSASL